MAFHWHAEITFTLEIPPCLSFLSVLWSEKEFHDAAKRNDTEKMQELIKKGVNVKAKNKVSPLKNKHASHCFEIEQIFFTVMFFIST